MWLASKNLIPVDKSAARRYLRVAIMQLMVVKPTVALACAALVQTESAASIKRLRLVTVVATAVAMHSIFTVYIVMKPFTRCAVSSTALRVP